MNNSFANDSKSDDPPFPLYFCFYFNIMNKVVCYVVSIFAFSCFALVCSFGTL